MRHLQSALVGVILTALAVGTALAAQLPGAPTRVEAATSAHPILHAYGTAYPFDFQFQQPLVGYGFKPGETVTVTVPGAPAARTVTTGGDSAWYLVLRFHWVFCGPNATVEAPPVINATGSQGSRATLALPAVLCPALVLPQRNREPLPAAPGTAVGSGRVVKGNQPVSPVGSPPQPLPQRAGSTVVTGFGFVPGETVMIRQVVNGAAVTPVHTVVADSLGRIRVVVPVFFPSPCGASAIHSVLQAQGNRGTAVVIPVILRSPQRLVCPVTDSGGSAAQSAPLAVHLQHAVLRPGRLERAWVQSIPGAFIQAEVTYPGGAHSRLRASAGHEGRLLFHWRVPRRSRPGTAQMQLTGPAAEGLATSFVVR